jgi:hypothetical protein
MGLGGDIRKDASNDEGIGSQSEHAEREQHNAWIGLADSSR